MAHSFKITDPDLEKIKCLNHKATAIWKKKLNSPIHALVVGRGRCRCRCGAAWVPAVSRPPSGARGLGSGVERRGQLDRSRTGEPVREPGVDGVTGALAPGGPRRRRLLLALRRGGARPLARRESESRPVRLCGCGTAGCGLRESGRRGRDLWSAHSLATGWTEPWVGPRGSVLNNFGRKSRVPYVSILPIGPATASGQPVSDVLRAGPQLHRDTHSG